MDLKINLIELIPKEWDIQNIGRDYVRVSYETKGRGNNPKSFILPDSITVDEEFVEAMAMYLGDGKMSKDLHHLEFDCKDKDMVKFILNFFIKRMNVNTSEIPFELTYKNLPENSIKNWADYLSISEKKIKIVQSERHREECFSIQIGGKILRIIFEKLMNKLFEIDFAKEPVLRRAFLRGLFAAEGGIGIVESENYIAYIAFHLSYEKEEKLAELVQKLLVLEGITSKMITRENKGERYIQITNWKNYYKCWQIGLFNLCQRKKEKFLNKVNKTAFFFTIEKEFMQKMLHLSGLSCRQIGLKLGIRSATLCVLNKGKTKFIGRKDLIKLAEFSNVSMDEVKKNILSVRVNRNTLIDDKSIIEFIV